MKPDDLKKKKKPELFALAKQAGLNVTSRMSKSQIISALTLHYTAKKPAELPVRKGFTPAAKAPAPQPPVRPVTKTPAQPATPVRPQAAPPQRQVAPQSARPQAAQPAKPVAAAPQRPAAPVPTGTRAGAASRPSPSPAAVGDRIVLMVRDPYWAHAYWELSEESQARARQYFGPRWAAVRSVLRVYDVTGVEFNGKNAMSAYDIDINPAVSNWYVNVPDPDRDYCVEVGLLGPGNDFFLLARSNVVQLPRASVSDVIDEQWAGREGEFEALFATALVGLQRKIGLGSLELRELMERRLRQELSSGFMSSLASMAVKPERGRRFRFLLDAELIVYGATEPDASVTVQGKPVKLREDGSFTLRFALPDGRQIIPAVAASADRGEERTVSLSVSRVTEAKQPRLLQHT